MAATFERLLRLVAQRFDVSVADIKSTRRTRAVLPARHVAAFLAHTVLGMTHGEIGRRLGGRDYTTIAMYCRAVSRRRMEDNALERAVEELAVACQSFHVS